MLRPGHRRAGRALRIGAGLAMAAALAIGGATVAFAVGGPTASFTFTPTAPAPGDTVAFTNGSVLDPEFPNDNLQYTWRFGDDSADSTVANPAHVYKSPGVYTVALAADEYTFTTPHGGSATTSATVTVAAPAPVLEVDRLDDEPAASACSSFPGDCSLRGAIMHANADGNAAIEQIVVPAGTYELTRVGDGERAGSLNLEYSASIVGAGSGKTIVDGNKLGHVLALSRGAGPASERVVNLEGLTLTDGDGCVNPGDAGGNGGGGGGGGLLVAAQATATD